MGAHHTQAHAYAHTPGTRTHPGARVERVILDAAVASRYKLHVTSDMIGEEAAAATATDAIGAQIQSAIDSISRGDPRTKVVTL